MQETPMLFPVAPTEFWKQIRTVIEEVVEAKIKATAPPKMPDKMTTAPLLKLTEVCAIFQVSKPTLYEWMRQGKIKSFKVRSRRYFSRDDIEDIIQQTRL